jgi:hypothetical protein
MMSCFMNVNSLRHLCLAPAHQHKVKRWYHGWQDVVLLHERELIDNFASSLHTVSTKSTGTRIKNPEQDFLIFGSQNFML